MASYYSFIFVFYTSWNTTQQNTPQSQKDSELEYANPALTDHLVGYTCCVYNNP